MLFNGDLLIETHIQTHNVNTVCACVCMCVTYMTSAY